MDRRSGALPILPEFSLHCSNVLPQLSQAVPDKGEWLGAEKMDFEGQWLWNISYMSQALLFTSCAALGKLLYLSESGSLTCKINTVIPLSAVVTRIT